MANDTWNTLEMVLGAGTSLFGGLSSTNNLFGAADSARAAGGFNADIDQYNSTKRINQLARDIQKVLGTQGTQAAATGFRSTSKSFLAIKAETLTELERQIVEETSASKLRQSVARYEADSRAAAIDAQARSSRTSNFVQFGKNIGTIAGLLG